MKTIRPLTDEILAIARSWEAQLLHGIAVPIKILARITVNDRTGCWCCDGWNSGNGYANIKIKGRTVKVHRLMFQLAGGEIQAGHVADHDKDKGCAYRNCIHPHHMTPMTVRDNTFKGGALLAKPQNSEHQKGPRRETQAFS